LKDAVVVRLIADVGNKRFLHVFVKGFVFHFDRLQALGTLAEPMVLGHFVDQDLFGYRGGLVLVTESLFDLIEAFGILAFEQEEGVTGEAMTEVVQAGGFFTSFRNGSGRVLRIFAIRFALGGCRHDGKKSFLGKRKRRSAIAG
jgi:hypothetical protein